MKPNAINYLSLARKAGRIEVGEEPTGACARAGHARLVLVAGDAPENTVRRAKNFVAGTEQQMVILPFTKDEMGTALGRTSVALAAMTDPAMALALLRALEDPGRYGKAIEDLTDRTQRVRRHQMEEKAHERNVRTGKKRREPETQTTETRQTEARESAPKTQPKFRGRRPDDRGPRSDSRSPRGREDRKPYQAKQGQAKPYARREGKPFEKKDGKPYASREAKPFEKRDGRPEHRGTAGEGKPVRKSSGGFAAGVRKPGTQGPRQHRPAVNGTAGYKTERKTHGGAEK